MTAPRAWTWFDTFLVTPRAWTWVDTFLVCGLMLAGLDGEFHGSMVEIDLVVAVCLVLCLVYRGACGRSPS
jgi:hypothetical protein